MTQTKIAVPITPEIALALEAGIKDALKTALGKENPRDKVDGGQTLKGVSIDMTLDIGTVTIGHDSDRMPTASIPVLAALGLLVKRMGATREAALDTLKEVLIEAISLDKKATKGLLAEAGVDDAVAQVKATVIAKLPRTKVAKTVTAKEAKLTITGVSQAQ